MGVSYSLDASVFDISPAAIIFVILFIFLVEMPKVNISTTILAIFILNALKRSITLGTKPPFLPLGIFISSIGPNGG